MDLRIGGLGDVREQTRSGHDHSRRAKSALQPVALRKSNLNGVQVRPFGQALDGCDLGAIGLHRQHGARLHRITSHEDGAAPALAGVTADVRAGQFQVVAQDICK